VKKIAVNVVKLEIDIHTFLKARGRIQLQTVWPYKNNGWNKYNGDGVRISYFRKETCGKTQYTMAFSADKKASRRSMSVTKSDKNDCRKR
jgi:hypothetical protein